MRRLIRHTLTAIACICAATATAQTHYVPHISVGAHAGASLSQYTFNPSSRQSFHTGFAAGVRFRYAEERHVGLLAELNIEQRGWKEDFQDAPFSYSRTLTFIELPVMTHIFFGSRTFKGTVNLGPQVGYMIGSSISSNFDYENPAAVPGFPARRAVDQMKMPVKNRFDYGIAAGLGIEWAVTRAHAVTLEGRFYYGLGNIFASSRRDPFSASRGISIMVTAGYWFRLK